MTGTCDHDALNLRAYLALRGATLDWRTDLARLFRSEAPVSSLVRDALATAIENEIGDGPSLDLRNIKSARDRFAKAVARHDWMRIGEWVEARVTDGATIGAALPIAADHFGASIKKCEAALTYYRRAKPWVDRALSTLGGATIGNEYLESLLHSIEADPRFKRLNANLLRELGLSQ